MRKMNMFATIILASSLFIACGGKDKKDGDTKTTTDDSSPAGKLDGTWEIKRAEGSMDSLNIGTIYEFKGNKLTFGKGSFKNPGTTEITDSTFSFQAEGNELKFMYNYKLNGDTLVAEVQNSGGQRFHLVKQ